MILEGASIESKVRTVEAPAINLLESLDFDFPDPTVSDSDSANL